MLGLDQQGLGGWALAVLGLLGLLPAVDVAVALVNRSVTRGFGATILPGLALRDGVPAELRTLVAVPILLTTRAAIEEQIERLEIHYLASPGGRPALRPAVGLGRCGDRAPSQADAGAPGRGRRAASRG